MINVISFSGRPDGSCSAVAKMICAYYGEENTAVTDLCTTSIAPCGSCDYRCFSGEDCPHRDCANELYQAICESERCFYILPNYCGYPPAWFFIFNERGCGFFAGDQARLERYLAVPKAFIVISNTEIDCIAEALKYHVDTQDAPDILTISRSRLGLKSLSQTIGECVEAQRLVGEFLDSFPPSNNGR